MDASNSKDSNITLLIEGEHQDGEVVDSVIGKVKLLKKVAFDSKVNNTIFYEWMVEELESFTLKRTCPNCGWEEELMSHGICSDCEDERRRDKYLYCD
jgi:hypothetical protein